MLKENQNKEQVTDEFSKKSSVNNHHEIAIEYEELMVHFIKDEDEGEDEYFTIIDSINTISVDKEELSNEQIEEIRIRTAEKGEAMCDFDNESPYEPIYETTSYDCDEITDIEHVQNKSYIVFDIDDEEFDLNEFCLINSEIQFHNDETGFGFEENGYALEIVYKNKRINNSDWGSREINRYSVYDEEGDDEW